MAAADYRRGREGTGLVIELSYSSQLVQSGFTPDWRGIAIIRRMKWILVILALVLSATAQSPAAKPSEPGDSTIEKKVDPKLHADAIKLVEVSGAKLHLQDNFKQMVDEGAKQMMEKCSRCYA